MLDVEKIVDGLHDYIARALKPMADRLKALEDAPQPERGEKGEAGERGEGGEPGPAGPQGESGRDGRDGLPGVPGLQGEKGTDGTNGRDGVDGKDGADGLGFDDLTVEHDGERGFTFKFQRGDVVKAFSFTVPATIDRGVFNGGAYAKGDGVTFGGSYWIAQKDAPDGKPGLSADWRLAVKKGRDGKDGKDGERGAQGERGVPGLNGRDMR